MIIGFLGKGGSGKSTLSTKVVQFLNKNKNNNILAIDADYNMDLIHNLEVGDNLEFLGDDAKFLMKKVLGVDEKSMYADIVLDQNNANKFSISNPDEFTKKYSKKISKNLSLMAVGPHSEKVLNDKMCSHGLGALLKAYLPLINIKENEYVVVDEKAGVDSVGTGIPSGFNMSIIVVEATVYGVKAAKQISDLLKNHYNIPFAYIINKVKSDTDLNIIKKEIDEKYIIDYIPFGEKIDDIYAENIVKYVQKYIEENNDNRLIQSVTKFKKINQNKTMSLIYIAILAFLSTVFGGYIAFKYKQFIHIFSGFTAGTLLALVFLEIIPEVTELNDSPLILLSVIAGFIIFHILEKIFSLHNHHQDNHEHHNHISSKKVGAWALILHSLFDGMAIGLAYSVSPSFGLIVAIGVIAHDFSDGFNTVILSHSKKLLFLDALAPILGIIIGSFFIFPNHIISVLFGIFAGILLYVSTSDILPEAHCDNKKHMLQNLFAMILGVIYIVLIMYLK